jgi:Flp pilus assembly protein TadD
MQLIFSQSSIPRRPRISFFAVPLVAMFSLPAITWACPAVPAPQDTAQRQGGSAAQTSPSAPPVLPLVISPESFGISVGSPQEMRLTDSTGRPIQGASWSVQNPAIAQLVAGRAITIFGVSPGTTTITATWNGQTVRANIHVLSSMEAKQLARDWANTHEPQLNPLIARPVASVGDADFHYQRGLELFSQGDLQSAIDEFWEAVRQKPNFVEAQTKLAYTLWKRGLPNEAIIAANHALKLNPNNPEAEKTLGLAFVNLGNLNNAMAHYGEALRLKPDYADIYDDIGVVYSMRGDHVNAIREYREALRLDPDLQRAHYNLAIELRRVGDLVGAVSENRESVRLAPRDPEALINLAGTLKATKDFEGSRQYYEQAIDVDSNIFEAHYGLGQTFFYLRDWAGMAKENAIAVQLRPRDSDAWCNLGIGLLNSGDAAGALKALTVARQLAPNDPRIRIHYDEALARAASI